MRVIYAHICINVSVMSNSKLITSN